MDPSWTTFPVGPTSLSLFWSWTSLLSFSTKCFLPFRLLNAVSSIQKTLPPDSFTFFIFFYSNVILSEKLHLTISCTLLCSLQYLIWIYFFYSFVCFIFPLTITELSKGRNFIKSINLSPVPTIMQVWMNQEMSKLKTGGKNWLAIQVTHSFFHVHQHLESKREP